MTEEDGEDDVQWLMLISDENHDSIAVVSTSGIRLTQLDLGVNPGLFVMLCICITSVSLSQRFWSTNRHLRLSQRLSASHPTSWITSSRSPIHCSSLATSTFIWNAMTIHMCARSSTLSIHGPGLKCYATDTWLWQYDRYCCHTQWSSGAVNRCHQRRVVWPLTASMAWGICQLISSQSGHRSTLTMWSSWMTISLPTCSINSYRPELVSAVVNQRIPGSNRTVVQRNVSFINYFILQCSTIKTVSLNAIKIFNNTIKTVSLKAIKIFNNFLV